MKKLIVLLFFIITNNLIFAQDESFFTTFISLRAGDSKFNVESKLNALDGFSKSDFLMKWDKQLYGTDTIQYSELKYINDNGLIKTTALFCNGKLYWKEMSFSYAKDLYTDALKKFTFLKEYVKENFSYLEEKDYSISNDEYGSDIGELKLFTVEKDTKLYASIECKIFADLKPQNALEIKGPWIISGYRVVINFTNLSMTPLNSRSGYFTY